MTTTAKTDITDRLYTPTEEEIEEYSRLYMTVENAKKTLLEDKTQTRRTFSEPIPDWVDEAGLDFFSGNDRIGFRGTHPEHGRAEVFRDREYYSGEVRLITTPHYRAGTGTGRDRIWDPATKVTRFRTSNGAADRYDEETQGFVESSSDWHQIHASFLMPTWASRIVVVVTNVWVERVQEISHEDAIAEGIPRTFRKVPSALQALKPWPKEMTLQQVAFGALWNDIHGEGAWKRNDWVRCVEYDLITD